MGLFILMFKATIFCNSIKHVGLSSLECISDFRREKDAILDFMRQCDHHLENEVNSKFKCYVARDGSLYP